jgi:diguanylate cyclase (GGDEF)-like protein
MAAEQCFQFHDQEVHVSLSVGVACNQGNIHSIEALYGAADEALYEAKRRGRNRAVSYPFPSAASRAKHA